MSEEMKWHRKRFTAVDGRFFLGEWNVTAGSSGVGEKMRIIAAAGEEFELQFHEGNVWKPLQKLVCMPDTQTLENRVDDDGKPRRINPGQEPREPERCISFWNRMIRSKAEKLSIFAMRVGANPMPQNCLPDSEKGEKGAWGAEEG